MRGSGLTPITPIRSRKKVTAISRTRNQSHSKNWNMHILVTADTIGGVWTYTRELVAGLLRVGHRVTLVSFGNIPAPSQTQWMEGLKDLDYRPTAFKLEWMQDSQADLRSEEHTSELQSPDHLV